MDDSGSGSPGPDHSWLAFSLSNNNYHHHSSDPSPPPSHHQHQHFCLFQHPQQQSPGDVGGDNGGGAIAHQQHNHNHHHDLPFLQVGLFPTAAVTVAATAGGSGVVYQPPPELKTLAAAGYLGGFPNHQQQQGREDNTIISDANQQQQQLALVPSNVVPSSSSNKKVAEGFGHRTSIYRGVTRHRWTGRYEAHLWDNSCRREGQSRKGRQVYLGGYDKEDKAARAYDLAALKYWGPTTTTNFPISDYEKELEEMKNMSRQEFVASLRRKSSGFSRGASIYRGVTRHHQHGRWQARIGRVAGNKDLYLGTFSTQEEAAEAYDIAAIKFRGLNAVTNFDISRYDVKSIITSNLPVGGMANKSRSASDEIRAIEGVTKADGQDLPSCLPLIPSPHQPTTSTLNFAIPIKPNPTSHNYNWPSLGPMDNNEPMGYSLLGGGGDYMQQQPSDGAGNDGVDEGYNGYGVSNSVDANGSVSGDSNNSNSWIVTPSMHSFQSPKPSLSVLQTPIFGIE